MGFWNKLGQIALQAAPYVAAPFTGGLSLSAAPLTGKLANKLEDKADRETFEKTGVAPSRNMMNKIMGGVNAAAGMYGGAKLGGKIMGGGNNPVLGNDLPSQGGITGTMGGQGGLTGFLKNLGANQANSGFDMLTSLGNRPPQPPPMNGPAPIGPSTGGAELPQANMMAAIQRGRNRARAY
jgi:hypothetical protein